MLQCIAVCCSALQCVTVFCSVLQSYYKTGNSRARIFLYYVKYSYNFTSIFKSYLNIPHVHIPLQGKEGEGEGLGGRGREKERKKVPGGICGEREGVESVDLKRCVR